MKRVTHDVLPAHFTHDTRHFKGDLRHIYLWNAKIRHSLNIILTTATNLCWEYYKTRIKIAWNFWCVSWFAVSRYLVMFWKFTITAGAVPMNATFKSSLVLMNYESLSEKKIDRLNPLFKKIWFQSAVRAMFFFLYTGLSFLLPSSNVQILTGL